ncbi:hypothetical protein GCM10011487_12340 [Steroidobacter agaridevorans]|uniref:TonB-dependent receptor n=1 Tax=Steroidobacter agaridevorans TaxID=2695856 RepID=A0A829Y7I9_9GAMM|nr:hypothetical protein GCM10011487_12340 [Steroidobacter agaridevorans]GFE87276.1 hypothetical protein GCM10011488_22300 [Steroidobacter agaridevorans]
MLEEVVVQGIRRSIEESIEDKRANANIGDTINAEDIGKSTDQSIADALSRVTGVTTQSVDGEGTQISIRGANPQQNVILLNGVQMSTTDFSQGIDLSAYSSDIIQKIVVIKAPSADHIEGALGGLVYLETPKPLELDRNVRVVTLQGRYGELSGSEDYKLSGSISQKFAGDTLGLLLTAFDETYSIRRDQFRVSSYIARNSRLASDPAGNLLNDVTGLVAQDSNYELFRNERNRHGIDFAAQWQATDRTLLSLNATWSEQAVKESMHGVKTRAPDHDNLVAGEPLASLFTGIPAPYTDPQQDWHTYDPDTRTFTKYLNRNALGDLSQSQSEYTNRNALLSVDLAQDLTDRLSLRTGVSRTKAERIPDQSVYVNLQNYASINPWLLFWTDPSQLEPVGYDCTQGRCRLVAGQGQVDYGPTTEPLPGNGHVWDNSSTTGFNPSDLQAQHLAFMQRNVVTVEDKQESAYLDFDWLVDAGSIRGIEFGARYSTIDKYVDNQAGTFNAVGEGVIVTNPQTGLPLVAPNGLSDIPATLIATGGNLGASDFMSSLGYPRDSVTRGWPTVSAFRAFDVALGNRNVAFIPDDSETRAARLENFATYLKLNFAHFDDRLNGDVGVRYVRTDLEASGSSGVNFHFDPGNLGRVFDPFVLQQLRDPSNPACSDIRFYGTDYNEETRWSRVDGQGWDTSGTASYADDVRLPDERPCYDARAERNHPEYSEWWLWRHSDVSTEAAHVYGDRPLDANGRPVASNQSRRSFKVEGEHEYHRFLPALNVNYRLADNLVARFAASKTMSRPQIDSLRPGFKVTESVWGDDRVRAGNTITLYNPQLDPLESVNLDVSLEWYFDAGALLSMGLFHKDMTNFEESEQIVTYMDDLRGLGLDPNAPAYDLSRLIRTEDDLAGCMPRRIQGGNQLAQDWVFSDDLAQLCNQFVTTRIKNGKGADIRGVELQYIQQYRGLPGFLSGLGVQMNYTYQKSEFDQEVSSLDTSVLLPALPVTYTPEHSYNATIFWGLRGHQLRLAYQGASDVLAQRAWNNGALWQEGRSTLDFSAIYAVNDSLSISFDAVNLTDQDHRTYFTSRFIDLGDVDGDGNPVLFDEGSPLGDGASKRRTVEQYKTGPIYRLGFRFNF